MNLGKISGTTYYKKVDFSKAIRWSEKAISIRKDIWESLESKGVETICFYDDYEMWTIDYWDAKECGKMKFNGYQNDVQFYLPIDKFIKTHRETAKSYQLQEAVKEI